MLNNEFINNIFLAITVAFLMAAFSAPEARDFETGIIRSSGGGQNGVFSVYQEDIHFNESLKIPDVFRDPLDDRMFIRSGFFMDYGFFFRNVHFNITGAITGGHYTKPPLLTADMFMAESEFSFLPVLKVNNNIKNTEDSLGLRILYRADAWKLQPYIKADKRWKEIGGDGFHLVYDPAQSSIPKDYGYASYGINLWYPVYSIGFETRKDKNAVWFAEAGAGQSSGGFRKHFSLEKNAPFSSAEIRSDYYYTEARAGFRWDTLENLQFRISVFAKHGIETVNSLQSIHLSENGLYYAEPRSGIFLSGREFLNNANLNKEILSDLMIYSAPRSYYEEGIEIGITLRWESNSYSGIRSGYQNIRYPGGNHYKGRIRSSEYSGKGTLRSGDGVLYDGEWEGGLRHGKGKETDESGNEYEGDWFRGYRHGKGKQTWPDGTVYEGGFRFDLMHGPGRIRAPDGTVTEGVWEYGRKK